jgi:predicted transcriptional regulator
MMSMDWQKFMAELQAFGLTQKQIADACEVGQATISDLARGDTKDPKDSLGQKLRALMRSKREEAKAAQLAGMAVQAQAATAQPAMGF